jgi:hypothetical protein
LSNAEAGWLESRTIGKGSVAAERRLSAEIARPGDEAVENLQA